jgi:hypothetical protein
MKQEDRVLSRIGGRELTPREVDHVVGAVHTATVCAAGPLGIDGDVRFSEC